MYASASTRRVLRELKELIKDPKVQSYFYYENSRKDENSQQLYIYGYLLPRVAPYKYGSYKVRITLPVDYPFKAPEMELLTYIYHPAVRKDGSGQIFCRRCCREQWSPAIHISQMIERFVNVIDQPEAAETYCVMDLVVETLLDQNRAKYNEIALAMVKEYSCPRPNPSIISLKFAAKQMICKQLYFDSAKIDQLPLPSNLKDYLNSSLDTT